MASARRLFSVYEVYGENYYELLESYKNVPEEAFIDFKKFVDYLNREKPNWVVGKFSNSSKIENIDNFKLYHPVVRKISNPKAEYDYNSLITFGYGRVNNITEDLIVGLLDEQGESLILGKIGSVN